MVRLINDDLLILEKKRRQRQDEHKDKKRKKNDKKCDNPKVVNKKKKKLNETISIDSDNNEDSSINLSKISDNGNNSNLQTSQMNDKNDSFNDIHNELQINQDLENNNLSLSIQSDANLLNNSNELNKKVTYSLTVPPEERTEVNVTTPNLS